MIEVVCRKRCGYVSVCLLLSRSSECMHEWIDSRLLLGLDIIILNLTFNLLCELHAQIDSYL